MADPVADVLMCTKCGTNPRADQDPKATNRQCLDCRAEYQRGYSAGMKDRMKDAGFVKGAEEFRSALIAALSGRHPGTMTTYAAFAKWIKDFRAPRPQ